MGNYLSIDSIPSFDRTISNALYAPPAFNKLKASHMQSLKSVSMFNISSSTLSINIMEVSPKFKTKKIIIFSHGNACDNLGMYEYLKHLSNGLGVVACSYDYPKYGLSIGELCETTCTEALELTVDHYLKLNYTITLVAQSIGTGVLINYVSQTNWKNSIVLISPYMSIPSIVFGYTIMDSCIVNNRYDTVQKIENLKCAVKIFHGVDDKLINISHAKKIFEILPNKKFNPVWIRNCDHNNILTKISVNDYIDVLVTE